MALKLRIENKRFNDLIDKEQSLKTEAAGFSFIEGGIWNKETETLIFNDIPVSKTYVCKPGKSVELMRENTHKANGNAYDLDGNIIVCEHERSCLSKIDKETGDLRVLVAHYNGKELNSPNDVVVRSNGVIYFTDPVFGRNPSWVGLPREQELDFQGVFGFYPKKGKLKLLSDDFSNPNGLCFSPDERYLYVNDPPESTIIRFKIRLDGSLEDGAIFALTKGEGKGKPDGMKVDVNGNVYCCAQGGIHVFDPSGTCLGVVEIPEQVGNCCFGGKEMKTLYIMATDKLYRFETKICGN